MRWFNFYSWSIFYIGPRGELGALPDDAEQNMRLIYLEKYQEKAVSDIDILKLKVKELEGCLTE
jgi:hypothetical protein